LSQDPQALKVVTSVTALHVCAICLLEGGLGINTLPTSTLSLNLALCKSPVGAPARDATLHTQESGGNWSSSSSCLVDQHCEKRGSFNSAHGKWADSVSRSYLYKLRGWGMGMQVCMHGIGHCSWNQPPKSPKLGVHQLQVDD
jgi:hypothetical protein